MKNLKNKLTSCIRRLYKIFSNNIILIRNDNNIEKKNNFQNYSIKFGNQH